MMLEAFKKIIPKKVKKIYWNLQRVRFEKQLIGNSVFCPICKSYFSKFLPGGMNNRPNARCYTCNSLERHRLLYLYLDKTLNFFNRDSKINLLHFAPEKFFYDAFLELSNIDYYPCDLFPEIYDYRQEGKVTKVDMTDIHYPNNSFDFILHNQVLEHIPNDKLAMQELFRVMKKGGEGIFQVPIDSSRSETYEDFSITTPEGRKKAFGQHDHVRWYGRDYKDRLESVGFNVIVDNFISRLSIEDVVKYGLTPNEKIYYCRKI